MMRQWAILIGLDSYQMFHPLTCAQQDAQALHQFLIHEAGFAPEQCILLTDSSPPISGRSTTPTRANLQSWIELLTQQCFKPGDMLWFFFSGYGVCSNSRDYLVPLDGDPFAVETTCILMSDIFSRIQASLSPGLPLVLLDINRSQGKFSSESVGTQTINLAKRLAVPTILSCQPGQFSREISSLGHGLFTVALQEALQYHQAATPETLIRFLSDRLAELGNYYYLPNQKPFVFCPIDKVHQPLLQTHFASQWNGDSNGSTNGNGTYAISPTAHRSIQSSSATAAKAQPTGMGTVDSRTNPAIAVSSSSSSDPFPTALNTPPTNGMNGFAGGNAITGNAVNGQSSTAPSPAIAANHASDGDSVVTPTVLSSASASGPYKPPQTHSVPSDSPPTPTPAPSHTATPTPETVEKPTSAAPQWRPFLLWGGFLLLCFGLIGCVLWRNWSAILAPAPMNSASNSAIAPSTNPPQPQATTSQLATQPAIQPTSTNINSSPANLPTGTVPPTAAPERVVDFNPATVAPASNAAATTGQTLLETARRQVLSDQATPYRGAIDTARQIPSTDPAYVVAQQDIAAWSQRILDIALERANRRQWEIAIMAAALVPQDDPKLHSQAEAAIAAWCPAIQAEPAKEFAMVKAKEICSQKPI